MSRGLDSNDSRTQTIALTAATTGASPAYPVSFRNPYFNIGFGVVVSGTVTYSVQHTFNDVMREGTAAAVWFEHDTATSASTNISGSYSYPVAALRLNKKTGTGKAIMRLLQSGFK